jgi:single-stranded DNA-binding protein
MMRNVNRCEFEGMVVQGPERKSEKGPVLVRLSVMRNMGPNKPPSYTYIDLKIWDPWASPALKGITKGDHLFVVGRYDPTQYEGKDGATRTSHSFVVEQFQVNPVLEKKTNPEVAVEAAETLTVAGTEEYVFDPEAL